MLEIDTLKTKLPPWLLLLLGSLMIAFLGITDYLTGAELSFSIFYLIPISGVTLLAGRGYGIAAALFSAGVWLAADLLGGSDYSHWLTPYWNSAVRTGYFLLHAFLLHGLTESIRTQKALSRTDPLTGTSNWRYFQECSVQEIQRAHRSKKPLTIAYIDLDNFKSVNDMQGHDAGDEVLRVFVRTAESDMRPADRLARIGGDEFAVLLPETDFAGADRVLGRIRDSLMEQMQLYEWPVTLSIGAVTFVAPPTSVETMINKADNLMYSVKKSGKNSIRHEQWPL